MTEPQGFSQFRKCIRANACFGGAFRLADLMGCFWWNALHFGDKSPGMFYPMKPRNMAPITVCEYGMCRICGNGKKTQVPVCYGVCAGCAVEKDVWTDTRLVWCEKSELVWMATPALN